jgi:hypothetical protein
LLLLLPSSKVRRTMSISKTLCVSPTAALSFVFVYFW